MPKGCRKKEKGGKARGRGARIRKQREKRLSVLTGFNRFDKRSKEKKLEPLKL